MRFSDYLRQEFGALVELTFEHAYVVGISIIASFLVAIALGVVAHRSKRLSATILNLCSVLLTIPSLALLALMIPIFGIGVPPTVVALALYGLLPIVRNTVSGLQGVDPAIVESAKGMGMGAFERLWRIEFPLAWPVILTGLRVSTQLLVGIAAVAALIGGPGLGNEIYRGIRSIGTDFAPNLVYGGTVFIVLLAVVFDAFFLLLGRLTTSRGIRD
jgi:osmoprotectant transport system permease protein